MIIPAAFSYSLNQKKQKKTKFPDLTLGKIDKFFRFLKFMQHTRKKNNSKKTKLPDLTLGKKLIHSCNFLTFIRPKKTKKTKSPDLNFEKNG